MSNGSLNTTDDEDRDFDGSGVRGSATVMSTVDENSGRSSPSNFPVCHHVVGILISVYLTF